MSSTTCTHTTYLGLISSLAAGGMALALANTAYAANNLLATTAPSAQSADEATAEPLPLTVGKQQLLQTGAAVARIAVGDPAVLDVKVLRDLNAGASKNTAELLLTPKSPGQTTLAIWPTKGQPQHWLVRVSGPRLLLERRLANVPDHAKAMADLKLGAPKDAVLQDRSQVEVRSNTVQVDVQVVEFKKSALRRAGMNLASGRNAQGFQFGVYGPGGTGSLGTSSGNTTSGSLNGNVGVSTDKGAFGSVTANGDVSNTSGATSSSSVASALNLVLGFGRAFSGRGITAQLDFMETNGLARILAKPTLVAHTGQSASFLAGGEIPIPVPSRDGNIAIQYKEFGVKLQLTPTILSDERIALKVAPEASDLDFSQGVSISGTTVPAVRTRRADTMVELADGESFIIGGLISRATMSNVNKVPLLGDLPILGTFFKSMSYSQDESELLIIVTPRLVQPLPANTQLEALLPGAQSEQPNAGQVWAPYLMGAPYVNSALPGFSY